MTVHAVRCWFCNELFEMADPSKIIDCIFCGKGIEDLDSTTQKILLSYNQDLTSNYKHIRTPCSCVYCWQFKREPRIGRNQYSIIEALADSAQQMVIRKNYDGTLDRVNRILKITRNTISKMPVNLDHPRCRFRVTKRERCSLPLISETCILHDQNGIFENLEHYFQ